MSTGERQAAQAAEAQTQEQQVTGLLDQILETMPSTVQKPQLQELIANLCQESMKGVVKFDRSFTRTIKAAIDKIDEVLSKQLSAILHHPKFQKLEGTWRGLHYLVMESETCASLKIKVLNASKKDLSRDFEKAVEFDMSTMFKKLYTQEFGQAGGEPFGALIGDYEFSNHPEDIELLSQMSQVAASGFCPFISAASPQLFGFDSWEQLNQPRDLEKIFQGKDWIKWRAFRQTEDSRFVVLTMPRVLARLPYGAATKPIDEFQFEEVELNERGEAVRVPHEHYTWMNSAFAMGARLTDAFAKTNWCTAIRGYANGGKIEGLPVHVFTSEDGDREVKCPSEALIPDRRDAELSKLGFLALVNWKNTDFSCFIGGQTTQLPKKYDDPAATENAAISARLPYLMAVSRISHFLKVMGREAIGRFMERKDVEEWLTRWIAQYICADDHPSEEMKAKYPLAEAQIKVEEVPGKPGEYNVVAHLRPWLQLEALNASMRLVTRIPKKT